MKAFQKWALISVVTVSQLIACGHGGDGGSTPKTQLPPSSQQTGDGVFKDDFENNQPVDSSASDNNNPNEVTKPSDNPFDEIDENVQEEIDKIKEKDKAISSVVDQVYKANNHQFSSLISKVDLEIDPENPKVLPRLSLQTRGADYKMKLTDSSANHYEFKYIRENTGFWDPIKQMFGFKNTAETPPETLFSASVQFSHFDSKILATIEVRDEAANGSHGVIHVIYLRKKGTLKIDFSAMTPEQINRAASDPKAQAYIERSQKDLNVIGEFYYVITDEMTSATRFEFLMSNFYYLRNLSDTTSVTYALSRTDINAIPLEIDSKGGFSFPNYSYKDIDSAEYKIMSRKPLVVLTHMQLNLNIQTTDDPKDDVPLQLLLNFPK